MLIRFALRAAVIQVKEQAAGKKQSASRQHYRKGRGMGLVKNREGRDAADEDKDDPAFVFPEPGKEVADGQKARKGYIDAVHAVAFRKHLRPGVNKQEGQVNGNTGHAR